MSVCVWQRERERECVFFFSGNPYWRGKLSTVDLFVLTSLVILCAFKIANGMYFIYKKAKEQTLTEMSFPLRGCVRACARTCLFFCVKGQIAVRLICLYSLRHNSQFKSWKNWPQVAVADPNQRRRLLPAHVRPCPVHPRSSSGANVIKVLTAISCDFS